MKQSVLAADREPWRTLGIKHVGKAREVDVGGAAL